MTITNTVRGIQVSLLTFASVAGFLSVPGASQTTPQASGPVSPESYSASPLVPSKASNGEWGYQDKSGTYVIPPQFVHAEPFHEGLALVYTTWGMNLLGKTEGVYLFGRVGYIDTTGKFVIGPRYAESARAFSEGLAAFQPGVSSWGNSKWGYLDKAGKWAIKPRFGIATDFSEGLACVQVSQGNGTAGKEPEHKWGYIDHTGEFVIPPQFEGGGPFYNGVAIVRTQLPPGQHIHPRRCIDRQGNFVTPCPPARPPKSLGKQGSKEKPAARPTRNHDQFPPGTRNTSGDTCLLVELESFPGNR
jgi:hypothetical protein